MSKISQQKYDASKVAQLARDILHHKRLYYAGTPAISDYEYDRLEEQLQSLAPEHPVLSYVGSHVEFGGGKAIHDIPMLSLQKSYDEKTLISWMDNLSVVGCFKLDGNSLALVYRGGKYSLAKTRGNGRIGEDVTDKAVWVADIIPNLTEQVDVEIRGELYCPLTRFGELSSEMVRLGLERPTNPRNIVAGILGRKNHGELARYFNFCAFDVIAAPSQLRFSSEWQKFDWLKSQGFSLPGPKLLDQPTQLTSYIAEVKEMMEQGDVALDGAVFTYNDLSLHEELGNTSHHPRYKMSFKWQGETAVAHIKQITWATSRYGVVTPVAVIDPVPLSGAMITNITLHNGLNVINNNLKNGDEIEIVRSGEVIPKFLRVITSAAGTYADPKVCPSCNQELAFDGVRFRCNNSLACPAQNMRLILNWIKCMEIDDLNEKRLENMIELGLVRSTPDLYRLTSADLLTLPATKEKMAEKLLTNIAASKKRPLAQFLNGLSIEGAGLTTWEKLLQRHPSLEQLLNATAEDIESIDGFAAKTAAQIVDGLKSRRALISELLAVGVSPSHKSVQLAAAADSPIIGKNIAITGKLSMPRADLETIIKQWGGHPASSVSKNTFALVTNDDESGSSKMQKARDLGVQIWSEAEFLQIIATAKGDVHGVCD